MFLTLHPTDVFVADADAQFRQYLGLAFVILAYVGGIIGWSWAALTIESDAAPPDTAQIVQSQSAHVSAEERPGPQPVASSSR